MYKAFADLDKVIILDQIPTDSIESYIQEEYLDAAIYINSDYQRSIDQNKQAKIIIKYKGTDSFGITRDLIKSIVGHEPDFTLDVYGGNPFTPKQLFQGISKVSYTKIRWDRLKVDWKDIIGK